MTQTEMKSRLLKRSEALESRFSGMYEKRIMNGRSCFIRPDGSIFTLDCLVSYGAIVIGYAENKDEALQERFEDGDLFYLENIDEETMYQSMLQEIERQ